MEHQATLVNGAKRYNSLDFIKTIKKHGKNVLDSEVTADAVKETFRNRTQKSVVPGFISTDRNTGEITNLGRGGSDYTASIIAAALDAEVLDEVGFQRILTFVKMMLEEIAKADNFRFKKLS